MNVAALISGGKDSIYAIIELVKLGYNITCLVCLIPKNVDSYMFHSINLHIVKYISKSLNIPLFYKITSGNENEEIIDLKDILLEIKKKYNIKYVCSGAIQSNYQKKKIIELCDSINLNSITPLWNKNLNNLLYEMVCNMDIRIVSVAADGFDESWLGKKLNLEAIDELKYMSNKYGINIIGEGGEFETIVLDATCYKYKIKIMESKKKWMVNHGYYTISKVKLIKK